MLAHGLVAEPQEFLALEPDRPGDLRRRGQQAQDGHGGDGLSGAGLAHDPERFAGAEVEVDAADGVDHTVLGVEADVQVPDGQDCVRGRVQACDVQPLHR
ncbi:hypothetical protein D3C85_1398400 [compost metagenome]